MRSNLGMPRSRNAIQLACFITLGVSVCCALAACGGPKLKEWSPEPKQLTYGINRRQLPPEPVYQRTRWVEAPDPLPSRDLPYTSAGLINPVIEMSVKRTTLEKAARALSASCGYRVYVASGVALNKVSLRQLGTIEELAQALADQSNSFVDVDHEDRAIRFLAARAVVPEFFEGETLSIQESSSEVVLEGR